MFLDEIRTKSSANDEFTEKKERIKKQNEKKKDKMRVLDR